jgi:hypothetical protein
LRLSPDSQATILLRAADAADAAGCTCTLAADDYEAGAAEMAAEAVAAVRADWRAVLDGLALPELPHSAGGGVGALRGRIMRSAWTLREMTEFLLEVRGSGCLDAVEVQMT